MASLRLFLSRADEEGFFGMVWGASMIESKRLKVGLRLFSIHPPEIIRAIQEKPYLFYKWALETLVNEWLLTPQLPMLHGKNVRLNTRHLGAALQAIRLLGEYENAEDGIALARTPSIFEEIPRLGQRQFPWQRGIVSKSGIYRAARLYIFDEAEAFYQSQYGLSMRDFSRVCFATYAHLFSYPGLKPPIVMTEVGIADDVAEAGLRRLATSIAEARVIVEKHRSSSGHPAYLPSVLRQFPCIWLTSGRLVAPLPELIMERATTGLFYDLVVAGPGEISRRIGENFEAYCHELLSGFLVGDLEVMRSLPYSTGKGKPADTPDLLLYGTHGVEIVAECKARRATFDDKFAEGGKFNETGGIRELVKGVAQIWRFASDQRRALVPRAVPRLSEDAVGMVLTLDTWVQTSSSRQEWILAAAAQEVANDRNVIAIDRLPIVFCPADELEVALSSTSDRDLLSALRIASQRQWWGYPLISLVDQVRRDARAEKEDPFQAKFDTVVNWMGEWSALSGRDVSPGNAQ